MTDTFGVAAVRLCGLTSQLLHWKPEDFWDATPADLAVALQLPVTAIDVPDAATINELKRRFPDE